MEMVFIIVKIMENIKVNGKMTFRMVRGSENIHVVKFIQVNGLVEREKEEERYYGRMEILFQDHGKMIIFMEKDSFRKKMEQRSWGDGNMEFTKNG